MAVLILVTSGLGLINPLMIKEAFLVLSRYQEGEAARNAELLRQLMLIVGIMVITPILSGGISIWQTYKNTMVGQSVMQDLRNALYAHLQHMPLKFFTSTRTGEIQSRLSNDVGGVQSVLTDTASSIFANITIVISTVVAMAILSWPLFVSQFINTAVFALKHAATAYLPEGENAMLVSPARRASRNVCTPLIAKPAHANTNATVTDPPALASGAMRGRPRWRRRRGPG